jgi:hypothetical protein
MRGKEYRMPKFVTISPTHVPGKKEYAWNNFQSGGYAAIGWLEDEDLTGKSIDEVAELVTNAAYPNEASALHSFEVFMSLQAGDYIAASNTNHGLFGVGVVKSGYHYEFRRHDTGAEEPGGEFYSHLIDVDWIHTEYARRRDILEEGETAWQPYGAVGALRPEVPLYITRLLGAKPPPRPPFEVPDWLAPVIASIEVLRRDPNHQERAHESLVEDYFCALGFEKHEGIRYRQGRVDVTICASGRPVLLMEVKAEWQLSRQTRAGAEAVQQAYRYALDQGVRYVAVTNGDVYLLFDRLKGLSLESNALAEFQLSALQEGDLETIERLRPESLEHADLHELFSFLSEAF